MCKIHVPLACSSLLISASHPASWCSPQSSDLRAVSAFPPHLWLTHHFQPKLLTLSGGTGQDWTTLPSSAYPVTWVRTQRERSRSGLQRSCAPAGPGSAVSTGTFRSAEFEKEFKRCFTCNFLIFRQEGGPEK